MTASELVLALQGIESFNDDVIESDEAFVYHYPVSSPYYNDFPSFFKAFSTISLDGEETGETSPISFGSQNNLLAASATLPTEGYLVVNAGGDEPADQFYIDLQSRKVYDLTQHIRTLCPIITEVTAPRLF